MLNEQRTRRWARWRVHPVVRDLAVTAAASLTNFLAGLALIALFGHLLGVALLAQYLLLRRIAGWLQPLAHLGLGVGVPRYVAYSAEDADPRRRQLEYFVAAVVSITGFVAALGLVLWIGKPTFAGLLFGDRRMSTLMMPLFLLLAGGAAQVAVYGFYRGCLEMRRAGAMQICLALVPIGMGAALFRTRSVVVIVGAIGCAMIGIAVAFAIPIVAQLRHTAIRFRGERALRLLKYGLSRVPGDLATGALLAIGPVIAAHYEPVERVSYLLIATSMLAAASVSTEPLGLVFLSKLSMMLARERISDVRMYLSHLMSSVMDISVFVTIQLVVFADVLLRAWIGRDVLEGVTVVRALLAAIPFYLFFTALRSAVDAGSVRPLNARNLMIVVPAYVAMIGLSIWLVPRGFLLHAIAGSLALAIALLALLTRLSLTRLFQVRTHWSHSVLPMAVALALGAGGLFSRPYVAGSLPGLAALELLFALSFFAVCSWAGSPWLRVVWSHTLRSEPHVAATDRLSA